MAYVAVTKVVKDLSVCPEHLSNCPDLYPLECEEFATREEALRRWPDASVMTFQEYNEHKALMNEVAGPAIPAPVHVMDPVLGLVPVVVSPKRWWQFWRWFR